MIREATAVKVRQNLGEMLNEVQYRQDAIVIKKDGKPVAALVDMDLFEKIRRMREEFDRLTAKFRRAYEGVDPSLAEAEIAEAVRAVRRKHSRKK